MKRTYTRPAIQLLSIASVSMLAASTGDPNKVVDGGGGTYIGGNSQEGGKEEGDGGTVGDMAKEHAWGLWEDE